MTHRLRLVLALCASLIAAAAHAQSPANEQQAIRELQTLMRDLHPVSDDISIPEADAVLHLGKNYYFLPAEEAKRVLVEGWGNPPETAEDVLGMVFPAGKTFADDTWGAVITFEPSGWVSDEDAKSIDYDALLGEMQSGEDEVNAARTQDGYPPLHLVGWAQPPVYEPAAHSLLWAKNIQFGGQPVNTLSYDVRLLGRRGVLSLNMITDMTKLAETRQAAARFARSATFNNGARYADYRPGEDAKADYGIAGLIAGGTAVAAAKKLGILAIVAAFAKKFFFLFVAGGLGLLGLVRKKLFGGKEDEDELYEEPAYAEEADASSEDGLVQPDPAAREDAPPSERG